LKIPDDVFRVIKEKLWDEAAAIGWETLGDQQKSTMYENWIKSPQVGGVISRYTSPGNVRVYIKDTIMKPYGRERIKEFSPLVRMLGLPEDCKSVEDYIKPHGRRLDDGKIICWGLAKNWKSVLIAVYERAYWIPTGVPYCAVLMFPAAKYKQHEMRGMINDAAGKLGILRLVWYDV